MTISSYPPKCGHRELQAAGCAAPGQQLSRGDSGWTRWENSAGCRKGKTAGVWLQRAKFREDGDGSHGGRPALVG